LQRFHGLGIDDHNARLLILKVIHTSHNYSIFFFGAVWIGDEPWLLSDRHGWAPGGDGFVLLGVVFVNGPMVLVVNDGLMHQLEQVSVSVLGHALPFWVVLGQVDAAEFGVHQVFMCH
jgi:hypothetical protein